jgi:cation diffusion facilitator family transporter
MVEAEQQKYQDLKSGERGAYISIVAYTSLFLLKLIVAHLADSDALRADGLNSGTDILASIAVLIGLKLSQKPADDDHPYGHRKAESVASLVASFIMMAVAVQVLIDGINTIYGGKSDSPDMISAWTAIFCSLVMYLVYRYNRSLGEKVDSQAVVAASKDNLSDAWVSAGTAIGIIGSQFSLPWLDPLTAIIVGVLISKTAWDIFRDASHYLTDGFEDEKIQTYKKTVETLSGVRGVKEIRARKYGNTTVVDIVILVDPYLDIQDAHEISTKVEQELIIKHGVYEVNVHVEPHL